jgi:uncharacterized protein GlcG (DUF336 family)
MSIERNKAIIKRLNDEVINQGRVEPLRIDGELIGAVGVSGGTDPQDHAIARAGAGTLQP